ncbi:MAG: hypothetical protein ACLQNE_02865 [Thermoguttaceae bacterium]
MEELEAFLGSRDISWERLDRKSWSAAIRQWSRVFGNALSQGTRYKEGNKARNALSRMDASDFFLLSVINESPHLRSSEPNPKWGYTCKAQMIPDLSQFCTLDFAMVASDYSWTMIYSHEDDILGGPYFTEMDWVTIQSRDLNSGSRRGERRRRRS